jgi:hypothetical protein
MSRWRISASQARSIAAVFACACFLSWPAIYNGFPLVFWDSGKYLTAAILKVQPIDGPVYFSVLTVLVGRVLGLWMIPFLQSLLAVTVLRIACSLFCAEATTRDFIAVIGVLGLLSPLPWLTSWIMADFLGGVLVLSTACIVISWAQLSRTKRVFLLGCALFAIVAHTGNLLLFAGLLSCCVAWAALDKQVSRQPIMVLGGVLVLGVGAVVTPNRIAHGEWVLTGAGEPMVAARLIEFGVFQKALARRCGESPDFVLCAYQSRLRGLSGQGFLHKQPSLAIESGAWGPHRREYAEVNRIAWDSAPWVIVYRALGDSLILSTRVTLGADSLPSHLNDVRNIVQTYYPSELKRFDLARQQNGTLARRIVDFALVLGACVGLLGTAVGIVNSYRVRDRIAIALIVFCAVGLIGNALVFGAFSGVFNRYQSRVVWLLLFLAMILLFRWARGTQALKRLLEG